MISVKKARQNSKESGFGSLKETLKQINAQITRASKSGYETTLVEIPKGEKIQKKVFTTLEKAGYKVDNYGNNRIAYVSWEGNEV
jgi:hypothetical protein